VIDLLVAGGGPAGLATAILGARAGLEVVVVERRDGPVDKACGEGLMPHAVELLHRLDVQPPGKPIHGITYLDDRGRSVTGRFRGGAGRGVRRTALHAGLLEAATAAGVRLEHADVGPVTQDALSVHCSGFRARYLAAADGLHSPIRAALGLARPSTGARRWGIRRHILTTPWSDCVEVYWSDDSEAYVTPVADDCVGIAILTSHKGGFDERLGAFPALQERVHGMAHGTDRAAGPLRQKVRSRTAGRVMLVGDAAGYVDALTGEGLGIAFGAADLMVQCVTADRPQDYDKRWRRMSRRYRLLTAAVLQASQTRPVRSRIVPAAAQFPAVFRGVVNLLAE
jgi:flavin-dependent dehydrogenase